MSDMREAVAREICDNFEGEGQFDAWMESDLTEGGGEYGECNNYFLHADAAIETATPYIEAALIERLIESAHNQGIEYVSSGYASSPEEQMDIADWLRAQGGQE